MQSYTQQLPVTGSRLQIQSHAQQFTVTGSRLLNSVTHTHTHTHTRECLKMTKVGHSTWTWHPSRGALQKFQYRLGTTSVVLTQLLFINQRLYMFASLVGFVKKPQSASLQGSLLTACFFLKCFPHPMLLLHTWHTIVYSIGPNP